MKITQQILVLLLLVSGCKSHTSRDASAIEIVAQDELNFAKDSTDLFFPLESFRDTSLFVGYDTMVVNWYSDHLFAMQEPILFDSENNFEIFRFTWLRTFHNPVAIRIQKNEGQYQLVWKVCDGAGGYKPGNLIVDEKKTLSKSVWNKFKKLIETSDFWELPTNEKEILGNDGFQWILEGAVPKRYHVIDRWTPGEKSSIYQIGDYLIALTNLEIEENEKY